MQITPLKLLRLERNISQVEMSKALSMSQSKLVRIERSHDPLVMLSYRDVELMADKLNITIEQLANKL